MKTDGIESKILNMNRSELNKIIKVIKLRQKQLTENLVVSFSVGDLVSFKDKRNNLVQGKVTKVNTKTVNVQVNHVDWRISPQLLTKL